MGLVGGGWTGHFHMCHYLFFFLRLGVLEGEKGGWGVGVGSGFGLKLKPNKPTHYKLEGFLNNASSSFFPVIFHSFFNGTRTKKHEVEKSKMFCCCPRRLREDGRAPRGRMLRETAGPAPMFFPTHS